MTEARSYSVTPHTLCVRHEDGTHQVFLMTAPKNLEGVWGFLMASSYKAPGGAWTRSHEHPQEWTAAD